MLIKKPDDIKGSEITPRDVYLNRRQFIAAAGAMAVSAGAGVAGCDFFGAPEDARAGEKLVLAYEGLPGGTIEAKVSFK